MRIAIDETGSLQPMMSLTDSEMDAYLMAHPTLIELDVDDETYNSLMYLQGVGHQLILLTDIEDEITIIVA